MDSKSFASKCISAIMRLLSKLFRVFKNLFKTKDHELKDDYDDFASQEYTVLYICPVYEKKISMISEEESTTADDKGHSKKGMVGISSKARRLFHRLFKKQNDVDARAATENPSENTEELLCF